MRKILILTLVLTAAALVACGDSSTGQGNGRNSQTLQNPNDTPTEAYKRLFAAVKSGNTNAIRKEVSTKTQEFAKAVAEKQKKSEVEVLSNGFTATTFSPTLPEIRDERVKDNMGALEVWNSKDNRWEDLPFIRETDGWKLAYGDFFAGTYRSPGKGLDLRQREAANANAVPVVPGPPPGANSNTNVPVNVITR